MAVGGPCGCPEGIATCEEVLQCLEGELCPGRGIERTDDGCLGIKLSDASDNSARFDANGGLYVPCDCGNGQPPGGACDRTVAALPASGVLVAHRGGAAWAPENTMMAFRQAVALRRDVGGRDEPGAPGDGLRGVDGIEYDCRLSWDGALIVMHDNALARTTDMDVGRVTEAPAGIHHSPRVNGRNDTWYGVGCNRQLVCTAEPASDCIRPYAYEWMLDERIPYVEDVFREIGRRIVHFPECKSDGERFPQETAKAMLTAIRQHCMQRSVVVSSFTLADLPVFHPDNIDTGLNIGTPEQAAANPPQALVDAGVKWANLSRSLPDATITGYVAAGLQTMLWTPNRQIDRLRQENLGLRGGFSNDPIYYEGIAKRYKRDQGGDPFIYGAHWHGMQSILSDAGNWSVSSVGTPGCRVNQSETDPDERPGWRLPDAFGNDRGYGQFILAGWACPIDAGTPVGGDENTRAGYRIQYRVRFHSAPSDTSRWVGLMICAADDRAAVDGNIYTGEAYVILQRFNGALEIWKRTAGSSVQLAAGTWITGTPNLGSRYTIDVTVSAADVTAQRSTQAAVISSDVEFRGRFFHFGKRSTTGEPPNPPSNSDFDCEFLDINVQPA